MESIRDSAVQARHAARALAAAPGRQRTDAIRRIADRLQDARDTLLDANARDLDAGLAAGLSDAFLDRLRLTPARIDDMATAVREIAAQDDPVGRTESEVIRPNGLRVGRVRTPLGVVAVIYEARPNVTSDAAALALRSGNAVILRGGSDARHSNAAIGAIIREAIATAGLPEASVTVLADTGREAMKDLLALDDLIDLVIPRGGEGLIRFVTSHSRIPVLKHYKGVCHIFLDDSAELAMAREIVVNAKVSRPSACNAVETLLVHEDAAASLLPTIADDLLARGCTLHVCAHSAALLGDRPGVIGATDEDWAAEYLDLHLAIRIVPSLDAAMAHIARWGTDHTEAIVTNSLDAAQRFTREVGSSCVMVNASTRFADGGQLGLGAEIGISTTRMHAYGPMGAEGLTTLRFVILGSGQIR